MYRYGPAHGRRRWIPIGVVMVIVGSILLWRAGFFSFLLVASSPVSAPSLRSLPSVAVQNEAGGSLALADMMAGRPAVIALWASWCPFCKDEFPKLKAMREEFGDRIVIIAVNRGESAEVITRSGVLSLLGADFVAVRDADDALYPALGGFSMPEMVFVNRDGRITEQWRGPIREEELRRHITDLISH